MDKSIFPLDPADTRPDTCLWSGWPAKVTHLTTATEPTPAPVDMVECFCGTHVWIAADGRRWTWGNPPEQHHCPPAETPREAAEAAWDERGGYWDAYSRGDLYAIQREDTETLTGTAIADLVIE